MTTHPFRLITGCEPEKFSGTVLRIRPGSIVDSAGNERFDFTTSTDINLAATGLNGLDTGTIANGDNISIYLISNGATHGFVASTSIIYGNVVCPNGYTAKRKLPFGFVYNSAWGGIPDYHLNHWPQPEIRFTGAESTATWAAVLNGAATTFTDIDFTKWIPDNARFVSIDIETSYIGKGVAGSGYIRTYGAQATGLKTGATSAYMTKIPKTHTMRLTSTRKLQYKVTGTGTRLSVFALSYTMTEPS